MFTCLINRRNVGNESTHTLGFIVSVMGKPDAINKMSIAWLLITSGTLYLEWTLQDSFAYLLFSMLSFSDFPSVDEIANSEFTSSSSLSLLSSCSMFRSCD